MPGRLTVCPTPIGNMDDVSKRVREALVMADYVACEDTRRTGRLLEKLEIRPKPRLVSNHEGNEASRAVELVKRMERGDKIALVSDAGMPAISDPGYRLVEETLAAGLPVTPLPGPSALLAALTASGLPTDAFFFAGFLPVKAGQKRTRLESLDAVPGTLVFYESPRRLAATLAAMAEIFGDRPAAVAREMTKAFEEVRRDSLPALAAHYGETGAPKGEIVICVAPPGEAAVPAAEDVDALLVELSAVMPASRAAAQAARQTGLPKQDLFARIVALKDRNGDG